MAGPSSKAHWAPPSPANPLFAFQLLGVKAGDKVSVAWLDNKGQKGNAEDELLGGLSPLQTL
jgi:hypothetical protein